MTTVTAASSAFALLDERVQRWIYKQGWAELRDIQEEAILAVLQDGGDTVIGSPTASGKTEAAFLPIASALAQEQPDGLAVLCLSPLKALINDQYPRLESLFGAVGLPVHSWHGDVPASRKRGVRRDPSGVLLITPESLEALFIHHGSEVPRMMRGLRYLVIDELHAFMSSERGRQLQALLHRVELAVRRRIPRIALSATIGDMDMACEFLRPGGGAGVRKIVSVGSRQALRLELRGYRLSATHQSEAVESGSDRASDGIPKNGSTAGDALEIARHLFRTLRGGRHLVFPNRRADVELYADLLRRLSEAAGVPNEFWPHHGSLDKTIREEAERALRSHSGPATIIATTTLELGIDIGRVESIAQIGPPPSVASMRQRLGRSGRREDPSVLRIYIQEAEITPDTPPQDQLRTDLVQSIAMVRLLMQRWYEPPVSGALHLSTLVQQVLSLISQHGCVRAAQTWRTLCQSGPFRSVDANTFGELLNDLGQADLIHQTHDRELVLGLTGERLVNRHDFYAAFSTPQEFRLEAGEKLLGTLPVTSPVLVDTHMIFAGQRWRVLSVDDHRKAIRLAPSPGGRAPTFAGSGPRVHDRVRDEMRRVYGSDDQPSFLAGAALDLLQEGREAYGRLCLADRSLLGWGKDTLLFPWVGDRSMSTLLIQLRREGLDACIEGVAILVADTNPDELRTCLAALAGTEPPEGRELARFVPNKQLEKHHIFLGEALVDADYASSQLDVPGAQRAAHLLLQSGLTT